jgi:hypothetical protein
MKYHERTEVFSLTTEKDVFEFCQRLQRLKEATPVSSTFTVALTVSRSVTVKEVFDPDSEERTPIEHGFCNLLS